MKTLFVNLLLLLSFFGFSQIGSIKVDLVENTNISADVFIGYDKFDYLYFVKNNTLHKIKNGESFEYKNLALGKISKVDLLNPLKIIVFYERFNTAVTLDNQLNETLKVNFSALKNPLIVTKIGIAAQNQLWIFDEITSQIYLYDTTGGALKATGTPISEEIMFYYSDFNTFEWMDQKKNWYQCSVFGSIEKLEYTFDFDTILFADSTYLFYEKGENVFVFNRKTKGISTLENIEKTFASLTFKNQILTIFTNQGISNYKIILP